MTKGFLFLLFSVLFNGVSYHLTKAALATGSPATVSALSATAAAITFLAAGFLWRRLGWRAGSLHLLTAAEVRRCFNRHRVWIGLSPLSGALGAWLFNTTTGRYGPETTAFLANLTLIFLVLGGLAMRERVAPVEALPILMIFAGALLFSYRGGELQTGALALMAGGCLFTAVKQLLVRKVATAAPLPIAMTTALLLIAFWAAVIALCTGTLHRPDAHTLLFAGLVGVCGSVVGMTLLYAGYGLIGVSRGAPLDAMRPLVVLLIGLILGAPLPGPLQCAGGVLIIGGAVLLSILSSRKKPVPAAADTVAAPPR